MTTPGGRRARWPPRPTLLAASPGVGLLAARILVGADQVPDAVNAVMAASPLPSDGLPGPRVMGFLGCGAVIRREAFLAVGGFSRLLFIGGEEQLMAYDLAAAGWAACYRPDIIAYHHPSASRQPATRRYQEARNRALVAWLRRPLRCALAETGRLTRQAVHDPIAGRALGGLAVRLPRALLGRRAAAGGRGDGYPRPGSRPCRMRSQADRGRSRIPRCPTPGSRW